MLRLYRLRIFRHHLLAKAFHGRGHIPITQGTHIHQQSVDSKLFIYSQALTTLNIIIPIRGDFDLTRVTTLTLTFIVECTHMGTVVVEIFTDHVPTIAVAHKTANRRWCHTTDNQWYSTRLCRSRAHHEPLPVQKLTVIINFLTSPHLFERLQILICSFPAMGKRHA